MNLLREVFNELAKALKKKRRRGLTKKASLKANRYYWWGILRLQKEAVNLTGHLTEKLPNIRRLFLNFLAERVLQGALHANYLHREYPYSSHADLAGINRGIIEAAVNYLYLLDDPSCERAAAFWAKSGFEECSRNDGLKKWVDHDDRLIKYLARCDHEPNSISFEQILQAISTYTGVANPNQKAWPKFKQRCSAVGRIWELVYDMEYKALSTWQHGDLSRVIISPSYARIDPEQENRNVFESLIMVQWTFILNYIFVRELAIRCKDTARADAIDQMFWSVLGCANLIVEEHSQRYQPDKHIRNQT
ncbi:MAG: DUF5677 domain-containing protein [Verrucomicrobiia bacterium]